MLLNPPTQLPREFNGAARRPAPGSTPTIPSSSSGSRPRCASWPKRPSAPPTAPPTSASEAHSILARPRMGLLGTEASMRVWISLVVLALSATAWGHDFVGAETCKGCHPAAYDIWRGSKHARAKESLSPGQQKD